LSFNGNFFGQGRSLLCGRCRMLDPTEAGDDINRALYVAQLRRV
jgi:hypothetical protein